MEEDLAANQRSAFTLSFTLALYISNGFGLSYQIQVLYTSAEIFFSKAVEIIYFYMKLCYWNSKNCLFPTEIANRFNIVLQFLVQK